MRLALFHKVMFWAGQVDALCGVQATSGFSFLIGPSYEWPIDSPGTAQSASARG